MSQKTLLNNKIKTKKAKVGVVGIGYVGTSVARACANALFQTVGFDIDPTKIARVNVQGRENLSATLDISRLGTCDIIVICVPTPINKNNSPNLSYLKQALTKTSQYLKSGQLVIIESSVAPGTTRRLALPMLESSGLTAGEDFFLSFSPERIDPGNQKYQLENTPKVVSGIDKASLKLAVAFYKHLVKKVVPVSSLEAAELTKVLENVFRFVNISLVNELAEYARSLNLNIWEIIAAASTKPYGFLAHFPGPGIGGDCIPVLPHHLLSSAKRIKVDLPIVKASATVDKHQPRKIASHAFKILNGKSILKNNTRKILLIGVSYKAESADLRQSPALKIWQFLAQKGVRVSYHDPYVPRINGVTSVKIVPEILREQDLVIIITAHKNVPYDELVKANIPVLDTRNVLGNFHEPHIISL